MTLFTKIISIVATLGLCLLAIQTYRISAQQAEIDRWKASLETAISINIANEKTLALMGERYNELQKILLEWKDGYSGIDDRLNNINNNIRKLGKDNEEVRAALSTAIPCELWSELFPNSTHCPNGIQTRKNASAGNTGTANK